MAIIWDNRAKTHTVRWRGEVIDTLAPTRFDSVLDDRVLETDIKADLESKAGLVNREVVVLLHICRRDPLDYVLLVAPPGYKPPADEWWNWPPPDDTGMIEAEP